MHTKNFLLTNNDIQEITTQNGQVFDQNGQQISEETTKGFNHILRNKNKSILYSPSLLADLTGTPPHFWRYAKPEIKEKIKNTVLKSLQPIIEELQEIRLEILKDIFAKRSRRAVNAKTRKNQSLESISNQNLEN